MATTKDNTVSVDETTLEFITSIQERIVDANKDFAAAVADLVPDIPFMPRPNTPDTKSLVEQSFEFQSRLLEANKTFSLDLIDAWSQATSAKTHKGSASSKKQ